MKKIAFIVLVSVFALTSCSKDDDTSSEKGNQFEYNGVNFKLGNTGLMFAYSGAYVYVELYSSSIAWDANTYSYSGIGDYIWFEINTADAGSIIEGRYEFNSQDIPNYLTDGKLLIGRNMDDNSNKLSSYVASGYIDLKYVESKKVYTIKFDVVLENGKSLEGNFTGSISYVYSKK